MVNPKPDFSTKRIFFASYDILYTENKMSFKSIPGMLLRESNEYRRHLFVSLYTGKEIHSDAWMELPIYGDVLKIMEEPSKEGKTHF